MYFSVFAYRSNVLCVLPTTLPNCVTDFLIVYVCMCMCVCKYVCTYHWAPGRVAFRLKAAPVKIRIFIFLYALHECDCVQHNTQTDRAYALRMSLLLSALVTIQGYVAVLIFIVHFLWVVYKLR